MVAFDCLARNCPLLGPHLLEASAGTGKTFSIEHVYVRLILEGIEVEQILALTFTRAATRELKERIWKNLEKALLFLRAKTAPWPYLEKYLDSTVPLRHLTDALASFDRAQIFTIHAFCYRMLKEFAFEAKLEFALPQPDAQRKCPEKLAQIARDFLEYGIEEKDLCPEQLSSLFTQFSSLDELVERLLYLEEPRESGASFREIGEKCKAALHDYLRSTPAPCSGIEEAKLVEDFHALAGSYKATKGDLLSQVKALARLEDPLSLRTLIREKGSLFAFLSPENRKIKVKEIPSLHYPQFFDWMAREISPLLKQKVWQQLSGKWYAIGKKILAEEGGVDPDEILLTMKKVVEKEAFAERVRKKYQAAIIDEFQDTDAVQWEIFQRLFLQKPLQALYLVGDPKQSIYRFRKADVYTYLAARERLGEPHLYQLDTNFRSTRSLVNALNALFQRDWLHLPKLNRSLPYHVVKAGAEIETSFADQKGALHFLLSEGEPQALFEEVFLPFAVREIEQLGSLRCAVLVKDRYQVEKALSLLQSRGIPSVAKSHTPIGQTEAFQAVRELFAATLAPHDQSAAKVVMTGPFSHLHFPLTEYKELLEESGLVPFARAVLKEAISSDLLQIFELLFAWEKQEGFSVEGLKRYLSYLSKLKPEEGGARRFEEAEEEAVQVMTLHISKGLEFDVVFALGLISRTPILREDETELEELNAEKLRQLYVAMTRAKKRLYVPIVLSPKEGDPGTHAPMELFCRYLGAERPFMEELHTLCQREAITMETLPTPFVLPPALATQAKKEKGASRLTAHPFTPFYLSSFTTLAKEKESKRSEAMLQEGFTLQTMPRGVETGIAIHKIFERIFRSSQPIWRLPQALEALVLEELIFSSLLPWQAVIQEMVRKVMGLPLLAEGEFLTLSELEPRQIQVETEFLFAAPPHFVKGFIDLLFQYKGKIYFLDWKTNWLEEYTEPFLKAAMDAHDYALQASLYQEAIQRHFQLEFGGAFYVFLRGLVAYTIPKGKRGQ